MSTTVHVQGISYETSEKEVKDFFSFCGKISNLSITPSSGEANADKSATVTFEKETAAKTALLLDNTQLGKSQVKVTTASSIDDVAAKAGGHATTESEDISQEDKPKSRIVAEYLAHGYALSDQAIQKAITIDQKGGYSSRFQNLLTTLDQKTGASGKAKAVDDKYNVTNKAWGAWGGLNSYFEKAIGTPTGQKLHQFYIEGDKQVRDVHNEARRLADLKTPQKYTPEHQPGTENKTHCSCAGSDGVCGCAPGQCDCAGCAKNNAAKQNPPVEVQKTSGLTACGCHSESAVCGCQPGKCSCKDCGKSTAEHTSAIREAAQATGQKLPEGSI